jgi:translation initiation factor IF-3
VTEEGQEVVSTEEALRRAQEAELDLVEISPNAKPPVCKILDLGSYLYQLKKKEKKQKAHSKQTEVKMVRFGFRTEKHDLERQADKARQFLSERHLVKASILLRGREFTNQEYAREKLRNFVQGLMDAAEVEQEMRKQGNQYIIILKPRKGGAVEESESRPEEGEG